VTVDRIIKEKSVIFVIIAGDFFNTAMPHIDVLKLATKELARLKDNNIPVYFISGSHDYSPSGRSMLHVLENANLMIDVQKARMEDDSLILEFTKMKKQELNLQDCLEKRCFRKRIL
jgi:DNA repair exonuclease SbcCD nuclease subunit